MTDEKWGVTDAIADHVRKILSLIGEDTHREGLARTPERVARAYQDVFSGYGKDPRKVFTAFFDGACDEMVVLRDIDFTSNCEHHMMPFSGKAHIGYLPDKRVVGVSKLVRLLEVFTKRLQIQERIGTQMVDTLMELLTPLGCGCILEATHFCLVCRGVEQRNPVMVTSAMRGVFLDKPEVRDEFMRVCKL
jgi:GTP cyclohydrolase I